MEIWIKGVLTAEDTLKAVEMGCDGIIVSNVCSARSSWWWSMLTYASSSMVGDSWMAFPRLSTLCQNVSRPQMAESEFM